MQQHSNAIVDKPLLKLENFCIGGQFFDIWTPFEENINGYRLKYVFFLYANVKLFAIYITSQFVQYCSEEHGLTTIALRS